MITSILDTALSDPRVTIGSLALAAISAAGLVAREWIRKAKHARNNAAQIQVSEREADAAEATAREAGAAAVLDRVLDRVDSLEARVDASDRRCEELRRRDRAEIRAEMEARIAERDRHCEERLDALRADLGHVAARQLRETSPDDTGVHQLARIARRTPTPPGDTPAQPERRGELVPRTGPRTLKDIPPPKRGKGD